MLTRHQSKFPLLQNLRQHFSMSILAILVNRLSETVCLIMRVGEVRRTLNAETTVTTDDMCTSADILPEQCVVCLMQLGQQHLPLHAALPERSTLQQ